MTNVLAARVPRVFARVLALAGLSLAAVAADVSAASAQPGEGMQAIQQMFNDPALRTYRLTSANLDKFLAATNALKALEDEDIDIEDHIDMDDPEDIDIGEIAAAFDNEPRIKRAINSAGMTSRDYVTFLFAMMQAMFGSVMVQMGGEQALNDMPDGVLKENIRFFTANQARFEALGDDN
ncbi:MAG: hypothetical protein KY467_09340 [Gemmatimonadetes bacterium]|nr:hypothetical protein [Gemmatimonadota bacterium]